MSDNSTTIDVSNAQRGKYILATPIEEGEHTDLGNDKWKGTVFLSDWFLESSAWVESQAILALLYKLCTCNDASGSAWLSLALCFSSPCDFWPPMICVMYRQGAKELCWGENIYHLCCLVTTAPTQLHGLSTVSRQALAHFLWGNNKNNPKIRGLSSTCFNNLE